MPSPVYFSPISTIVQYLNNLGILAQGAQLFTYVGGSVSTPLTTYTDSTGVVANDNPMTLPASGRPASASAAPVAFWTVGGALLKLVVNDAGGTQLVSIDNIPAINDLTNVNNALQTLLANPASANVTGSGPVAGADLVANAVKSYDVFANVRAANAPVLATGQTLIIEVEGSTQAGDNRGGQFYWSATSTLTDDGRTVLKPNSVAGASPGRYLRLFPLGVPICTVKPTDQSITVTTTLTNDDTLFASLFGSSTYLVQLRLMLLGVGGTGQGWRFQLNSSVAVTQGAGGGVSSGNLTAAAQNAQANVTIVSAAISSTTPDTIDLDFIVVTAADVVLHTQFAQNSSSGNATVMKAGSTMLVTRLT